MPLAGTLETKSLLRIGALPVVSIVPGIGLAAYFAYHTTRFHFALLRPLAPIGDASIMYEQARRVVALAGYPGHLENWRTDGVFPYPPSAVLIFHTLGLGGGAVFMAVWFAAMAAGLATALRASLAGERREICAAWLVVSTITLIVADGPVLWDLRNANSNLVCLGLVLGGYALMNRRPALAGALAALSVAIKPYSGLLLIWLVLCGPRRAGFAGIAAMLLLAVAWPVLAWGARDSFNVYLGWLAQLNIIADPEVHAALAAADGGPPIVSLGRAAMTLTGQGPLGAATASTVGAMWTIWLVAILWYVTRAWRSHPVTIPSRAGLADWTVLLLAPLPFSPWLEPYHAVPILPGAILLVLVALDDQVPAPDRRAATAALAALLMTRAVDLPFALRGIVLLVRFLVVVIGLGLLRPRLSAGQPRPA